MKKHKNILTRIGILVLVGICLMGTASMLQAIWGQISPSKSIVTAASPSPTSQPESPVTSPSPSLSPSRAPLLKPSPSISPKPILQVSSTADLKLEFVGAQRFYKIDKRTEVPNVDGQVSFQNYPNQPFRVATAWMSDPNSYDYTTDVIATAKNDGPDALLNVEFELRSNGVLMGKVTKDRIDPGAKATMRLAAVNQADPVDIPMEVSINGSKAIPEKDFTNNSFKFTFGIDKM